MPRRPARILETLDPEALAAEAVEAATIVAARLIALRREDIAAVVAYASRGGPVPAALAEVTATLGESVVGGAGALERHARLPGDPSALDLALHAAWARSRIDAGQEVPASALVLLGGYAPGTGTANRLVRAGELRARRVAGDWWVEAGDARVWLAGRR